jgi:hypothetical protein
MGSNSHFGRSADSLSARLSGKWRKSTDKAVRDPGRSAKMRIAGVMESLWTSRPRWSVIALRVWLLVRIHVMNQNDSPAVSEDVLAALPTRATRETNERQPHRLNQSRIPRLAVGRQP